MSSTTVLIMLITFCYICTKCAAAASPKLSDDEEAKLVQTIKRIENASDDEIENVLKQMAAGGSNALKQSVDGIIKDLNEDYEFFKKVVDEASTHLSPKANQKLQNQKQLVLDRKLTQEEFDKKLAAIESNPDVEEELKSSNLDLVLDIDPFANDFFELDKNNDGFVSLEELSTEKAKKADINGDGKLSPYEYVRMG
uniref:EF-hand domain-containing protein n=1 Tax=Globodera rostochiensis TaxID=31243 RepID=A0A914IE39_GLORO